MNEIERLKLLEKKERFWNEMLELSDILNERDEKGNYFLLPGTYPRKQILKKFKEVSTRLDNIEELLLTPEDREYQRQMELHRKKQQEEIERPREQRRKNRRPPRIIPSRTCFTCIYNKSKFKSSFIICKFNNDGKPLWEKCHCMKWGITHKEGRSSEIQSIMNAKIPPYEYNYRIDKDKEVPIKLGRSCFTCEFRTGNVVKGYIECSRHEKKVWELASCHWHRMVKDFNVLIQFKKYIDKGSGLDFRKIVGWDK